MSVGTFFVFVPTARACVRVYALFRAYLTHIKRKGFRLSLIGLFAFVA